MTLRISPRVVELHDVGAQQFRDEILPMHASVAAQRVRNTGTLNDRDSGRMTALVRWRPVRGRSISPQSPERRRGLLSCCADASVAGAVGDHRHMTIDMEPANA